MGFCDSIIDTIMTGDRPQLERDGIGRINIGTFIANAPLGRIGPLESGDVPDSAANRFRGILTVYSHAYRMFLELQQARLMPGNQSQYEYNVTVRLHEALTTTVGTMRDTITDFTSSSVVGQLEFALEQNFIFDKTQPSEPKA